MNFYMLFSVLVCAFLTEAAKLPSYIAPCSLNSSIEEFSQCHMASANKAIPKLINGDRKYRIPNMNPLTVPELSLSQGSQQVGLSLNWKPAQFWGLGEGKVIYTKADPKNRYTELRLSLPKFAITGNYTASGRILLLPITGTGQSSFNVTDLIVQYEYKWPIAKAADGKQHLTLTDMKSKIISAGGMKAKISGLFGGDRLLGDNMNAFINENWREVIRDMGPGIAEACGEVAKLVFDNIVNLVSVEDGFFV